MHHEFEWCSTMDGTTDNLFAKAIGAVLRTSNSGVYNPCPIPIVSLILCVKTIILICLNQGDQDRLNFTIDDNFWPSPLPSGIYRTEMTHGKFWVLHFDTEVFSDIRTSF